VLDVSGTRIYVASFKAGVYALATATGNVEWVSAQTGTTTLLARDEMLLATGDGKVTALARNGGQVLWSVDLSSEGKVAMAGQRPLLTPGYLLVPTSKALVFIDPRSGQVKTSWNPGKGVTATPARLGQRLYVLTNLGTVFAMKLVGAGG
jgi:outer membrane protein assembly factor BamB